MEVLEERLVLSPGALDPSFGTGGEVLTGFLAALDARPQAAALQADGKIVVATTVGNLALLRYNANGGLDTSFGTGGELVTSLGGQISAGVLVQADQKIVVAGSVKVNGISDFELARYNPDGSVDAGFGTGGTASIASGAADAEVCSLLLQPDNKLLVAGTAGPSAGVDTQFVLARYNSNGSIDSTFGQGSLVTTTFGAQMTVQATGAALAPDGKILVVGNQFPTPNVLATVVRYTTDGSVDASFGTAGIVTTAFNFGDADGVIVQPDGRVVVAGGAALARYTAAGSLDPSFGQGGMASFLTATSQATRVLIEPDNKIVAAGLVSSLGGLQSTAGLERFNPDGSVDASFGSGGTISPNFGGTNNDPVSLLEQPDHKLVLVTDAMHALLNSFRSDIALARYNTDGGPDRTFGSSGQVITTLTGPVDSQAQGIAVQADGKIVVVGSVGSSDFQDFAVARYNSDGSLDASFGNGGRVSTDFGGKDTANAVAIQPDGKIVVVGISGTQSAVAIALARYNPDGSPDTTFGTGGEVTTTPFGGADAVAIQPDGKIVVAGGGLVRYEPNGSLDPSFGQNGEVQAGGTSLVLQPDGRILLASETTTPAARGFGLVGNLVVERFNGNGTPDSTFGSSGSMEVMGYNFTSFTVNPGTFRIALQTDDKILAMGFPQGDATGTPHLVRLNPDGTRDNTFAGAASAFVSGGGLVIQLDGRIVVAGGSSSNGGDFLLERFNVDGSVDTTFGSGGEVTTNFTGGAATAAVIVRQADGKLVVAGTVNASQKEFALARYINDDQGSMHTGDPNQRWLSQLYLDLLQRPVDPSGLQSWMTDLANGVSRVQVTAAIESSEEYHTLVVQGLYGAYLGRSADPGGLQSFVQLLDHGGSVETVKALILASPEYFARGGGTDAAFLSALYRDVLGRPEDPSGQKTFGGALAAGVSPLAVAEAVLGSPEAFQDVVTGMYERFLRRPPDASGLATFVDALQHGASDAVVLAAIVGSPEYFGDV